MENQRVMYCSVPLKRYLFVLRYADESANRLFACSTMLDRRYNYMKPTAENWPAIESVKEEILEQAVKHVKNTTVSQSAVTVESKG